MTIGELSDLIEKGQKKLGDSIWNMDISTAIVLIFVTFVILFLYSISSSNEEGRKKNFKIMHAPDKTPNLIHMP